MHLCLLCGPPTAFTRHKLVAPCRQRTHDHRLNHPARGDGCGEFVQRRCIEMAARLIGVRLNRRNRKIGQPINRRGIAARQRRFLTVKLNNGFFALHIPHQRAQPPAQLAPCNWSYARLRFDIIVHLHAAFRSSGSRPSNSRARAI